MRNQMRRCPKCGAKTRRSKVWYCQPCGYLKPERSYVSIQAIRPYTEEQTAAWKQIKDIGYREWLKLEGLEHSRANWDKFQLRGFNL